MVEVQMAAVCPMYDATVGMGGGAGVVNLSSSAPPVVMTTTMAGAKVLEEEEGEVLGWCVRAVALCIGILFIGNRTLFDCALVVGGVARMR